MKKTYNNILTNVIKCNENISQYIHNNLSIYDYTNISDILNCGGDISKGLDIYSENIFKEYLLSFADIYSEESGLIQSQNPLIKNAKFIIDPLDGSDNFISSIPYFGSSISLQINDITCFGLVYNFINNTYIYKTPYESNITQKDFSTLGIFERSYTRTDICQKLSIIGIKYRSPGASALSLANAHNVKYVLVAGNLRIFDIDAACYICNDLYQYKNDNFLLISKDKIIFEKIKEIIKDY